MTIEKIAELCHEINRIYCSSIGDNSQVPWDEAPDWQKESAIQGVKFAIEHPRVTPEDMHKNWLKEKLADGWTFGKIKNIQLKFHPCCVPYSELPEEQKFKDFFFLTIVRVLSGEING